LSAARWDAVASSGSVQSMNQTQGQPADVVAPSGPLAPSPKDRVGPGPERLPALLTEIDHVAIAVEDLDAAIDWYRQVFGAEVVARERVDRDGVEEALLGVADSFIQLLTPIREDSPVAKFLQTRGQGIHHVGYRVADCATALEAVKRAGVPTIDAQPRPGSRGTTVAFVHPKGALGTLIELVEA